MKPLDWAQYAKSENEFFRLRSGLRSVPHGWLKSVEQTIRIVKRAGIRISDPLQYRLSSLIAGMVNLQEAKYLSDVFENSLRHSFVEHTRQYGICWDDLLAHTPEAKSLKRRLQGQPTTQEAVLEMTSYQLTESMARHWTRILDVRRYCPGFRRLFWSSPCCRDRNLFRQDTTFVRDIRNVVAHSKQLLSTSEVVHLLKVCSRWLQPLDVDMPGLVALYRVKRPQFMVEAMGQAAEIITALFPSNRESRDTRPG